MAKSKSVKQAEAIIRNKSSFEQHNRWYKDNIPGGVMYAHNRLIYGIEEAKAEEAKAEKKMLDAAARANIDRDGNDIIKTVKWETSPKHPEEKYVTKRTHYRDDALDAQCIIGVAANPDVEQDLRSYMLYNGYC